MTYSTILTAQSAATLTILAGVGIFLLITLVLVAVLLTAKKFLVHTGKVTVNINNDKDVVTDSGKPLLATMADNNISLPSACGGKGSCGQCKVQVFEGGGEILPTETVHFSRKQVKDHWRLACQVKVKDDMKIGVPASVLDIKEWECTVISNKNVATFIKEFIVELPAGETTTRISTRIPSAPNICPPGRNSDSSRSSAATTSLRYAPTPWPTTLPKATASC